MRSGEFWKRLLGVLLVPAAAVLILLCFLTGLSNVSQGKSDQDRQQLEDVLRRAAVACYACEGIYPPDLQYLQDHYGVQIDEDRYLVSYDVFASNLMPDITVLEREP